MLVLQRKVGTSVEIQGGITITILELCNGGVRMGIDAPSSVKILRTELIDNPQIELGAPPAIKPEHLHDIRDVLDDEQVPTTDRYTTPMQKVDYYTRGIDKRKNHQHED